MILAARHRSYSRFDSSPVASGRSRSCSMMKRSIVTTDVDVCTLALGRKADSAGLVRPDDLTATPAQPLEHQLGAERLDHGWQPAQMIRVPVRRHHHGEAPGTVTSQERDHHPAPRVAARDPRAAVDHHPAAVRRSESCRVALPYIQEKYSQATAIVERDDVTERRRYENRDQKCGTGPNQPAAARGIP